MQWKLGPVWHPCNGQSKTGSIQSFALQPLPPSPVEVPELLPLLLPPNRPPSGSVIGGKVMPLLELVAPLLLPLTPLLEEEGAEPSSPDVPEEEGDPPPSSPAVASSPLLHELQPPLLVVPEPPLELPPTEPELPPPWLRVPESRPCRDSATLAVHPAATTPNDTTQANANFSSNLMAEGES